MSVTTVHVTTTRTNLTTGDFEVLNVNFINNDKAWDFYIKCIGNKNVTDVRMGAKITTYNNVDTALASLAHFA